MTNHTEQNAMSYTIAFDISDDGAVIVGEDSSSEGKLRAFRWEDSQISNLGLLPGMEHARAQAVDAMGKVVIGYCFNGSLVKQSAVSAFWWEEGQMVALPPLPGNKFSAATAISDNLKAIVGSSWVKSPEAKTATLWHPEGGAATSLLKLAEDTGSEATHITADGTIVVGSSWKTVAPNKRLECHVFLWTADGGINDLGLGVPVAMTADGRTIACNRTVDGKSSGFLLDARAKEPLDVPLLPGCEQALIRAMDASGNVVVGVCWAGPYHTPTKLLAFLYERGKPTFNLASPTPDAWAEAFAVDAAGKYVAGLESVGKTYNENPHYAYLWFENREEDCGTLEGFDAAEFRFVNRDGTVAVGFAENPETTVSFIWDKDGKRKIGPLP